MGYMSEVYSWENISEEVLKKEYSLYLDSDSPKASPYYNKELVIDMEFNGYEAHLQNQNTTNKQGWARDTKSYWEKMLEKHPDAFNNSNRYLIEHYSELKVSPKVNQQFIDYFGLKEYEPYIGQTLVHHHIGQDGQAVAIPYGMHKGGETSAIHRIESDIGVTGNAEMHSKKIQEALDAEFLKSGDDVWSNLENGAELGTKSKTKFQYIQELNSNDELLTNFEEWKDYSGKNKELFRLKGTSNNPIKIKN